MIDSQKFSYSLGKIKELIGQWNQDSSQQIADTSDRELVKLLSKASHIKRLFERGQAEPKFRQQVIDDFQNTIKNCGLDLNFDDVAFLWQQTTAATKSSLLDNSHQLLMATQNNWGDSIIALAGTSTNPNFKAWRSRQIARCTSQLGKQDLGHFPVSFELNKGCSVGCWFCGVSAPKLQDIFFYTAENAQLWRNILYSFKQVLGSAAGAGFCYCATDPLDNPDYEKFLGDFYDILGVFPQTTTAQPLKDPDRTRYLLKLSLEKGCMLNRFSIISLQKLEQLYQEFTPEELAFVGLVLQNPESGRLKSNSGRARQYSENKTLQKQLNQQSAAGTTACVTGFLLNLVDRSVKLISPYPASDRYPHGYRVYEQGTFSNGEDLKLFIEKAIEIHMPLTVRGRDRLKFRSDLEYQNLADGFQLSTPYQTLKFAGDMRMKQLGELIRTEMSAEQIASLMSIWGVSQAHTYKNFNLLFNKGVLDDQLQSDTVDNSQLQLVNQ